MLHAPDFLGYESAMSMARDHREIVERGLRIKKAGNELIALSAVARCTRSTFASAASGRPASASCGR